MTADYNANPPDFSGDRVALRVPPEQAGRRLDQALAGLLPAYSRARLQHWIRAGQVAVDGLVAREVSKKLWGHERIILAKIPDEEESRLPEAIPLAVVHEDRSLIVLDKPPGLVVHPGNGNPTGTLMNALLFHFPALKNLPRAGIVHRLDKETSGLMVVAKTLAAQTDLVRQLAARAVKRHYRALARGQVPESGTIDAPIGRHLVERTRMTVRQAGKPARTDYRVLRRFVDCALIECSLWTGRTHQIRVHLAHIGHPLVGDPVYGRKAGRVPAGPPFSRQALHAFRLGLVHPETGQAMQWTRPAPEDLRALIASLDLEAAARRSETDEGEWEDEVEVIYTRADADPGNVVLDENMGDEDMDEEDALE